MVVVVGGKVESLLNPGGEPLQPGQHRVSQRWKKKKTCAPAATQFSNEAPRSFHLIHRTIDLFISRMRKEVHLNQSACCVKKAFTWNEVATVGNK